VSTAIGAPDESDETLIRASACGEEHSFARLVERYRNRVAQLVRWHLGPRSLWADDVAQDVFVRVHRNASTFEGRSSFKTWLYSIALNTCRDHVRRETAARRPGPAGDSAEEALAALPDGTLDPLQRLERREREALVRGAVERLALAHRTVLQLRDWEDMSYEQIAAVLDVPVGTVRSRLHNARAALARELIGCFGRYP
jgi:RNA polymerase sigma-70 factor (ECF subfamily)